MLTILREHLVRVHVDELSSTVREVLKKKSRSSTGDVERWRSFYTMIFPDAADIPSPHYGNENALPRQSQPTPPAFESSQNPDLAHGDDLLIHSNHQNTNAS